MNRLNSHLLAGLSHVNSSMNGYISDELLTFVCRANVSLIEHPSRDELILFGGEFFDGRITHVYNDLFIYDTTKSHWKRVHTPQPPPPRSSHQVCYQ